MDNSYCAVILYDLMELRKTSGGQIAMRLPLRRPAAILLCFALVGVLVVRGIAPGTSRITSDFPGYITAAKIVAHGGDIERLYDNMWFQEQIRHYRVDSQSPGKFAPFPPPTALLLVPLAQLEPLDALRVVTGVSVVCLIFTVLLLSRILSWTYLDTTAFVLLSGYAVINALRLGQPYIWVSFSCVLGYYAYLQGRPWLAGACFGLFVPMKYLPIVFLIYFACRREWKVALGGAIAILAIASVSIGVLGWKIHEIFLSSVLGDHLIGKLSMQDPFTASFQSFDSLFRRLFVFDPASNPRPLIAAPGFQIIGVAVTKAAILLAALATLRKLARDNAAASIAPSVGLLGILALLVAPATATYHFVLLWLPVGLLIDYLLRERVPAGAYFILGAYALIGFFPYRLTAPLEGRGGLTVLAYPRLLLLLAMFTASVYFIWHPLRQDRESRDAGSENHLGLKTSR